jgi:hypothetical protein
MIGTSKKALITDQNNIIISQSIQTLIGSAFNFPTDMTLQENKGYWIKCSNNGIITLTPPQPNAIFSFNSPINNVTIELNSVSGYYILDDNGTQIPFSTLSTTIPLITSNSNLKIFSTVVKVIDCVNCNLVFLNVSALPALQTLYCYTNPLTTLTFGPANTALTSVDCHNCSLVSLNVSALPALQQLRCNANLSFNTLTFGPANTALTIVNCESCNLASLDVSALSALESLYCYINTTLTTLTFGPANTKLVTLYCNECSLVSLNVSDLSALYTLYCYTTPTLTTLTFGPANTKLVTLYCHECSLSLLDVSLLSSLKNLICDNNTMDQTAANTISAQLVAHTTITSGLLRIRNQKNSVSLNITGPNYSTLTSRGWAIA